jgi:CRISPR-associated protein Csd2
MIDQAHEQDDVKNKEKGEKTEAAREYMCKSYYDVRTFGAVMSTGKNAGQVRGPVQLTFARSVDPVVPLEHSITRMAVATEAEAEKQQGDNRTMGRKFTIPYALYRCHGFISAPFAEKTGFSDDDLNLFWEAVVNMFEHDRSAARGQMAARKLFVFRHNSKMGNVPANELFDLIKISRKDDSGKPPRDFSDYQIDIAGNVPGNVALEVKI